MKNSVSDHSFYIESDEEEDEEKVFAVNGGEEDQEENDGNDSDSSAENQQQTHPGSYNTSWPQSYRYREKKKQKIILEDSFCVNWMYIFDSLCNFLFTILGLRAKIKYIFLELVLVEMFWGFLILMGQVEIEKKV